MSNQPEDQPESGELIAYLVRTTRLNAAEAARVVNEVLAFMDETPEDFIRRRHLALQSQGYSNAEIFTRLSAELSRWRFCAGEFSQRQLRRVIYG